MKIYRYILSFLIFFSITGWGPFSFFSRSIDEPPGTEAWLEKEIQLINSQASNIDRDVLKLSLTAYLKARQHGWDNKQLLTIIDYTKPSTEKRLWVVDLKHAKVLFNTWVTHGKNSGKANSTSFSNQPGSLKSSIGVFLTTGQAYMGENGYSLRMQGLEPGINDNAYRRDIVFHGAWYAASDVIKKYGFLGRSWGCPAVNERTARPLIDTIKGNTLVVAYSDDRNWLRHSAFLER
ncbi:MAG TPA: murein L,D-transpeptidase catalytic domain family protein [Gammaproteobacteria bacterium]|nr:murein L,D-transpeptidase catalytic domain family protein [Gammaproteobacteria bacterium]